MIRTQVRDERTREMVDIGPNDERYWTGPYTYQPYPKAMYRFTQIGQQEAETIIVKSDRERDALGSLWKESPADAKDAFDALQHDLDIAAAESAARDQSMSEKAKEERLAHERSTEFDQVVDVPAPKKKPGRPKKHESPS